MFKGEVNGLIVWDGYVVVVILDVCLEVKKLGNIVLILLGECFNFYYKMLIVVGKM